MPLSKQKPKPSDFRNSRALKKARKKIFPLSAMHNVLPAIPKFLHFLTVLVIEALHIVGTGALLTFCVIEMARVHRNIVVSKMKTDTTGSGGVVGMLSGVLFRPYVCYLYDAFFPSLVAGYHLLFYATFGSFDLLASSFFTYKLLLLLAVYQSAINAGLYYSGRFFYFLSSLPRKYANPPAPPVFPLLCYLALPWSTFTVWLLNVQQAWTQYSNTRWLTTLLPILAIVYAGRWQLRKPCILALPRDGQQIKTGLDIAVGIVVFSVLHFGFLENDFFLRTKNWKYIFAATNAIWPPLIIFRYRKIGLHSTIFNFFRAEGRSTGGFGTTTSSAASRGGEQEQGQASGSTTTTSGSAPSSISRHKTTPSSMGGATSSTASTTNNIKSSGSTMYSSPSDEVAARRAKIESMSKKEFVVELTRKLASTGKNMFFASRSSGSSKSKEPKPLMRLPVLVPRSGTKNNASSTDSKRIDDRTKPNAKTSMTSSTSGGIRSKEPPPSYGAISTSSTSAAQQKAYVRSQPVDSPIEDGSGNEASPSPEDQLYVEAGLPLTRKDAGKDALQVSELVKELRLQLQSSLASFDALVLEEEMASSEGVVTPTGGSTARSNKDLFISRATTRDDNKDITNTSGPRGDKDAAEDPADNSTTSPSSGTRAAGASPSRIMLPPPPASPTTSSPKASPQPTSRTFRARHALLKMPLLLLPRKSQIKWRADVEALLDELGKGLGGGSKGDNGSQNKDNEVVDEDSGTEDVDEETLDRLIAQVEELTALASKSIEENEVVAGKQEE
ncbi:unnamed protein product [Amoebophrya sp. A25]|nr:unnamed protein product [Amoebophrya sp. A25]|eukprot:GSA25T00005559001.1